MTPPLAVGDDGMLITHGWTSRHDYDPYWDYAVVEEHAQDPLILLAQQEADRISALETVPWPEAIVFPVDLGDSDHVARYVFGTCSAPVLVLDVAKHTDGVVDPAGEVIASVRHELRHALQEYAGDGEPVLMDEHTAEHGHPAYPF